MFRNVNHAFKSLVERVYSGTISTFETSSRYGDIIQVAEPVLITYTKPMERVLFSTTRDCNPFFHLYEALWMLAGKNTVKELVHYNPRMAEFSDDGQILSGAYGYRWRRMFGVDQLDSVISELSKTPNSRRVVLNMWNPCDYTDALGPITMPEHSDSVLSMQNGKDIPCNTHAYFQISRGSLNMTVCNRSNDMIWGMFGANVFHFSILQEYIASCLNIPIGVYNQFTNNLHVYKERWNPEYLLRTLNSRTQEMSPHIQSTVLRNYDYDYVMATPLKDLTHNLGPGEFKDYFEHDLEESMKPLVFLDYIDKASGLGNLKEIEANYKLPFFKNVVVPVLMAFEYHKKRDYQQAFDILDRHLSHPGYVGNDLIQNAFIWLRLRAQTWGWSKQTESK